MQPVFGTCLCTESLTLQSEDSGGALTAHTGMVQHAAKQCCASDDASVLTKAHKIPPGRRTGLSVWEIGWKSLTAHENHHHTSQHHRPAITLKMMLSSDLVLLWQTATSSVTGWPDFAKHRCYLHGPERSCRTIRKSCQQPLQSMAHLSWSAANFHCMISQGKARIYSVPTIKANMLWKSL